jgi:hypothetical protein
MKGDHCPCIAINHGHAAGQCDEPEPASGGSVCLTCRYAVPLEVSPDELVAAIRDASGLTYRERYAIYALIEASRKIL